MQGEGEEKDERHIRDSKGGGEAEMEENTARKVKCEKSVERGLEKKRVEKLAACSHKRSLEVCVCFFFFSKERNSRGVGLRVEAGSCCETLVCCTLTMRPDCSLWMGVISAEGGGEEIPLPAPTIPNSAHVLAVVRKVRTEQSDCPEYFSERCTFSAR